MLRKASVDQIRKREVTREDGYIALTMHRYPRGLSKTLVDEYIHALAPDEKLLNDFHDEREKRDGNHNAAFGTCHYEDRFSLSADGVEALKRLAELSEKQDVFFVCQCKLDQRCHRELLLLLAKKWFGAKTELRKFSYPHFEKRIPDVAGAF